MARAGHRSRRHRIETIYRSVGLAQSVDSEPYHRRLVIERLRTGEIISIGRVFRCMKSVNKYRVWPSIRAGECMPAITRSGLGHRHRRGGKMPPTSCAAPDGALNCHEIILRRRARLPDVLHIADADIKCIIVAAQPWSMIERDLNCAAP